MPELFNAPKTHPAKKISGSPVTATPSSSLSSFMVKPNGIRFETQEAKEEIFLLMRQHPIRNVGWILATLGLVLLPGFIVPLFLAASIIPADFPPGYFVVLPLLWYLGVFGFAFTNFLHWYFNVYILTSERVVDIDWVNLLYKRLSSTHLANIQDVTYRQSGFIGSLFDFGNVYIQTAGTDPNFEFDAVPKPNFVVTEINKVLKKGKTV